MKIAGFSQNPFCARKINKAQANKIQENLLKAKNVDIICHESTDKDAVNSALVMAQYLENKGINSRIILSQDLKALHIKDNSQKIVQAKDFIEPQNLDEQAVLCVDFNSKNRISSKISSYIEKIDNITGLDHHIPDNIVYDDYTVLVNKSDIQEKLSPFYIDTTSKSATAVVYRFLEALEEEVTPLQAFELMSGLMSDCNKKNLVKCNGENGTIKLSQKFIEDKNTYEVFEKLAQKLTKEDISQIARNVDLISSLNPKQEAFKNSLFERVKFSPNKKIAYIEIPPNDKQWEELGSDNPFTSTILNRFRTNIINGDINDERFKNVQAVFAFYRAGNNYRLSAHTKEDNLLEFYEYIAPKTENGIFQSMGGHPSRGGAKMRTLDCEICHKWVQDIISCDEFFD